MALKEHLKVHGYNLNVFPCPQCTNTFTRYTTLKIHLESHQNTDVDVKVKYLTREDADLNMLEAFAKYDDEENIMKKEESMIGKKRTKPNECFLIEKNRVSVEPNSCLKTEHSNKIKTDKFYYSGDNSPIEDNNLIKESKNKAISKANLQLLTDLELNGLDMYNNSDLQAEIMSK